MLDQGFPQSNNTMVFFKKAQANSSSGSPNHAKPFDLSNSNKPGANDDQDTVGQTEFVRLLPGDKMPNQGKMMFKSFISLYLMLLIEVGIPLALYYGLRNKIGVIYALVISGIPPFLWVIFTAIRKRTIDVLGCIIGVSFILSGVVSIVSGKPLQKHHLYHFSSCGF